MLRNIFRVIHSPVYINKVSIRFESSDCSPKELVALKAKEVLQKEFSDYYSNGKFVTRISYVDFVDQALDKLKELGLEKNLEAYKELLRVFPPGKYQAKSRWDLGLFHAPQQLCAIRLLHKMESNLVKPDKEIERIVVDAFGKTSQVWMKCVRSIYWSMKARNLDPNPLPEKIPEKTHEIAKLALMRMLHDPKSLISVKNTTSLPNIVDKTWVVYSQSPIQQSIIEKLDPKSTILYIEEYGLAYVRDKFLSYFVLKLHYDEETIRKKKNPPKIDYDYNRLKVKFYGKTLQEKLEELDRVHEVDDGHILSIAFTGTSSHDSVLSWLKLLQQRNPNLKDINVVFKLDKPTAELSVNP